MPRTRPPNPSAAEPEASRPALLAHYLREALDQTTQGRRGAAYSTLLEAFRLRRAPEIAEIVERAAVAFAKGPDLEGKTQKALVENWLERARAREPYEARWLLGQLEGLIRAHKGSLVSACLDELGGLKDDPSMTSLACSFAAIDGGTVNFGSWGKVLSRLFKLVVASGDLRALPALEALAADAQRDLKAQPFVRTPSTNQELIERIPKALAALRASATPHAPLDEATRATLGELARVLDAPPPEVDRGARSAPSDDERLFAAVLADLDDDAARQVWADALLARADPRGELIALQLARSPKHEARIKKLVQKHWRGWVGALAPAIVASSVEIDRGLLVACTTDVRRKGAATAVFGRPGWAGVRRITMKSYGLLTSAMTHLESALVLQDASLEALDEANLPRLATLEVVEDGSYGSSMRAGAPTSRGMKALAKTRGLPALRVLLLRLSEDEYTGAGFATRGPREYAWVTAAPWAPQLAELGVGTRWYTWKPSQLESWLGFAAALPALTLLHLLSDDATLVVDLRARALRLADIPKQHAYFAERIGTARAFAHKVGLAFEEGVS
jgi:uncharacterized protein (TIGR02996 family)